MITTLSKRFRRIADGLTTGQTAVADLRAEIVATEDRLERAKNRPQSKAVALDKARRDLAEAAEIGQTILRVHARAARSGVGGDLLDRVTDARDARALLALVAAPQLLAAFETEASALWGDDLGLTEDEREQELTILHRELFDLELAEEALIRSAAVAGLVIDRRPDAHPAAVLAPDHALPPV
ncbi:hypothetical protein [Paracoccus aminophilus]|nr:hypothetical protein [Paracoccus aminophilus]